LIIRRATAEDWPRIWPFFHEIVGARETYVYDPEITEARARDLWMPPAPFTTVVAVDDDGAILGSAKVGPNHAGPGSHVATAAFMVNPRLGGRGAGRALAEHALEWARSQGYHAMQFNAVVETNTRAVALWKAVGFEVLTTVPEAFHHPEHGFVGLHIMHRRL
jgi:L-amino acid N-acyltransferase YncA